MNAKGRTARITKINRASSSPRHDLDLYCRDLNGWPRSWMGLEKDLPPGEKLVACFRPFLEASASSDLSPKVIQKYVDNLWSLGGEIIRNLNETPSLRRHSIERILADRIDDEGGPLVYAHESEESLQRSLQEASPLPLPEAGLTGQITHKFPRRGAKKGLSAGIQKGATSDSPLKSERDFFEYRYSFREAVKWPVGDRIRAKFMESAEIECICS